MLEYKKQSNLFIVIGSFIQQINIFFKNQE